MRCGNHLFNSSHCLKFSLQDIIANFSGWSTLLATSIVWISGSNFEVFNCPNITLRAESKRLMQLPSSSRYPMSRQSLGPTQISREFRNPFKIQSCAQRKETSLLLRVAASGASFPSKWYFSIRTLCEIAIFFSLKKAYQSSSTL